MVYQLTCPECGAVVKSPFVRVGAITRCGRCAKRYAVREDDLVRPSRPNAPTPVAEAVVQPEHTPGLSGLTNLMKQQDTVADYVAVSLEESAELATAIPVAEVATALPAGAAELIAQRKAQQKRKNMQLAGALLGLAVGGGLVITLMVTLLKSGPTTGDPTTNATDPTTTGSPDTPGTSVAGQDPASTDPTSPDSPGTQPQNPTQTTDTPPDTPPAAPPLVARSANPAAWKPLDTPTDARTLTQPTGDPVRVLSLGIVREDGADFVEARLISDTLSTIDDATLSVYLVNPQGMAVQVTQVPAAMIPPLESKTVRVMLPAGASNGRTLAARAKLERSCRVAEPIGRVTYTQEEADAGGLLLKLKAEEPVNPRFSRVVLFLKATDHTLADLGTWRVDIPGPFGVEGVVAATAHLPLTRPDPVTWTVTGHALE